MGLLLASYACKCITDMKLFYAETGVGVSKVWVYVGRIFEAGFGVGLGQIADDGGWSRCRNLSYFVDSANLTIKTT